MAVTSIARIQHRRGLKTDLPLNLYEGELGWCLDTRELFIGNGPASGGNTQILTNSTNLDTLISHKWSSRWQSVNSTQGRGLGSKFDETLSVFDFGAKGDGISDDSVKINAGIAELFANLDTSREGTAKRLVIKMPAGIYLLNSPLVLYPNVCLIGDGIGNTILLAGLPQGANPPMPCVIYLADSKGLVEDQIGGTGGTGPSNISVSNLSIDTNAQYIDGVHAWRYNHVSFDNVSFKGAYEGSGTTHSVFVLSTGTPSTSADDFWIEHCVVNNFTYGLTSTTTVSNTTVSRTVFANLETGVHLGAATGVVGPKNTQIFASRFKNLTEYGILLLSNSPGVVSVGNSFESIGLMSIWWNTDTNVCASIGDTFEVVPGVQDDGSSNIIINPQQNNLGGGGGGGAQGFQGRTGAQGFQGSTGDQGYQGHTGAQGYQGSTGAQGYQGSTGYQGFQGSTGAQGYQGSTGSQGYQGPTGLLTAPVIASFDTSIYSFAIGQYFSIVDSLGNTVNVPVGSLALIPTPPPGPGG